MSKYRIILDGKTYEMEIEKLDGSAPVQTPKPAPAPAPKAEPKAQAAAAPAAPAQPAGSGAVVSPMPGTILKVFAAVGDAVKSGQTVMVLEAMKMENEIVAPRDGKISALYAAQGDAVQGGAALFEIGE